MTQPGQFKPPGDEGWMGRELADIKSRMQRLEAANVFGLTGIKPKAGGTDLDGFVNVNGPMVVNGTETVNGPITINGAATITGTLSLPAGIIGNDALSSPSTPVASHADTSNFSLTTGANVEKLRATITVPVGFTKAAIYGTATMSVYNNSTLDSCYLAFRVNGTQIGWSNQVGAPASQRVMAVAAGSGLVSGLSGGTIYVSAEASTNVNTWAADNSNTLNIDALVTFYR